MRKKSRQRRRKRPANSPATEANSQALEGQKKKRHKSPKKDISHITCWNYDKKGYYFIVCTKPAKANN